MLICSARYGTGSGQQSVTGFPEGDDSNSIWVRPGSTPPSPCIATFCCNGTSGRPAEDETVSLPRHARFETPPRAGNRRGPTAGFRLPLAVCLARFPAHS